LPRIRMIAWRCLRKTDLPVFPMLAGLINYSL
jgi:hypothetical protein